MSKVEYWAKRGSTEQRKWVLTYDTERDDEPYITISEHQGVGGMNLVYPMHIPLRVLLGIHQELVGSESSEGIQGIIQQTINDLGMYPWHEADIRKVAEATLRNVWSCLA